MLQLVPYNSTHFEELDSYTLDEFQAQFTTSMRENILVKNILSIPEKYPITVIFEQKPIGFFILDNSEEKFVYTDEKEALLLRSLSLNPQFQGKGLGKQTILALDSYIKDNFPIHTKIVLAVNERNTLAKALYLKSGYTDTGKTVMGIKGLQYIMEKSIC